MNIKIERNEGKKVKISIYGDSFAHIRIPKRIPYDKMPEVFEFLTNSFIKAKTEIKFKYSNYYVPKL